MKRYIRYVLLMVLSLLPINVFAATELTQAEFDAAKAGTSSIFDYDSTNHRYVFKNDGVYELAEDIDISSDSIGVVQIIILDFQGKTISTLDGIQVKEHGSLNIISGGTINSIYNSLSVDEGCEAEVGGGTYEGTVYAGPNSFLTIHGGTFSGNNHNQAALFVYDMSEVRIDSGEFFGAELGYSVNTGINVVSSTINPTGSLTINGGIFRGLFGMSIPIEASSIVHIAGGDYSGEYGGAAIQLVDHNNGFDFNTLLVDGYEYIPELIVDDSDDEVLLTQSSLVVRRKVVQQVAAETPTEEKKEETKNPKTGDFIRIYVLTLFISALGLLVLRKRMN